MEYKIGDIISGIISGVKPYGVFIKFGDTFGFCHISNCSHKFIKNLNELFPIESEIKAKIIEIHAETNKINVSIKDCENQEIQNTPKINARKSKFEKPKQDFKKAVDTKLSFDDMLKNYLKVSEERIECIGKRNQKHRKR